jgi:hypothetical protein
VYLRCGFLRRTLFSCIGLLIFSSLVPRSLTAADETTSTLSSSVSPTIVLSGSFSMRYFFRTTEVPAGRESDQDVFADLRIDLTRPRDNRYELHVMGTARSDIDGNQNMNGFYPFEDVGDTWGQRAHAQLIEANMVLNDPLRALKRITIGRQSGTRDEPVIFDGVAAELGKEKLLLTLYGGAAAHFYEIGTHWGEDTLEGAGIDYRPLPSLGISADALAVKDRREFDQDDGTTLHDRMVSFKIWQRFEPFTRIDVQYRYLNGESRDLSVKAGTLWQQHDAELNVSYFRQFNPQAMLSNELSPFFDVLGVSAPFQSFDARVRKFISSRVALDRGYFRRDLLDSADEGPFDKAYSREFIDAEVSDIFFENLSWTVTAEHWRAGSTSFETLGTDLTYRIRKGGRESRLSAGTFYSLYKYDYYTELGMRDQVRTYYMEGKYPFTKGFSVNGRYEYESSIERYQTVRLGMRYDF